MIEGLYLRAFPWPGDIRVCLGRRPVRRWLVKGQSVPKELYVPHVVITGANLTKYYHPTNC